MPENSAAKPNNWVKTANTKVLPAYKWAMTENKRVMLVSNREKMVNTKDLKVSTKEMLANKKENLVNNLKKSVNMHWPVNTYLSRCPYTRDLMIGNSRWANIREKMVNNHWLRVDTLWIVD